MLHKSTEFARIVRDVFGRDSDKIETIATRAAELLGEDTIVWEGDPQTFQFSFVSPSAERVLGHECSLWTTNATFWADQVVHPLDRDDAIAYCALATGKSADHAFEYRARRSDGATVWLVDYVRVVVGPRRVPERLRGVMVDVTEAKQAAEDARWEDPPRPTLEQRLS